MTRAARRSRAPRRAQRGVVMFIALIVLVAMTLAGIALSRSVGTGVMIAGNLSFQQGAASAGDAGIEAGRAWLMAQDADTLRVDQPRGYFANWDTSFDPARFDWNGRGVDAGTDTAGNTIQFVVHRLCRNSNESANAPGQQCVALHKGGVSANRGGGSYGVLPLAGTLQVYYRVTARVTGPRNTVSYVQSVMY